MKKTTIEIANFVDAINTRVEGIVSQLGDINPPLIDVQGNYDDAITYRVQGDLRDSRTLRVTLRVNVDHPLYVNEGYIDDMLCACAHAIVLRAGCDCYDDDALKSTIDCTFIPSPDGKNDAFVIESRIVETF